MRFLRMFLPVLALSLVILWGGVEQVQALTTTNPIQPSTWGAIKAMYGNALPVESTNGTEGINKLGNGYTTNGWDPSGYQLAIQREAFHALSPRNNGTSGVTLYIWGGAYYGGDWDYVNDPGGASALSAMKSHYNSGQIGSYGFWREDWITKACVNVGHGGYCKFFADLVQWRAAGGAKGYLPCNTCAGGSVRNVGIGDIIQIPSNTTGHTAVVIGILAKNNDGSVKTVDVIDSNYIGGDGKFIIARHPISQPELDSYRTYH